MIRFASLRSLALAPLAIAALSCGDTTESSPTQLNLDRPADISFACYGGLRLTGGAPATVDQVIVNSAQPLGSCDTRSLPHESTAPKPSPVGQEPLEGGGFVPPVSYYGFILQSSRGTVAVARWEPKPPTAFAGGDVVVDDADPLTPGKNGISVGEDPIAIATDRAGCKEITANAGSCDLSVLDIGTAVDDETGVTVERLEVTNAAGVPINARPAAMVAEPQMTAIGNACPATGTGLVYVAYPSCHLVAAIDVSNGKIVAGIQYDLTGLATITDGNVTCPDECGGAGAIADGPRPVTLDLESDARVPDLRRLVIGSDNFSSITVVTLDATFLPMSQLPVALEDPSGKLGVTAVALTPQIGMGGDLGVINDTTAPGGQAQYVYAITTDNTVRVVDILPLVPKECDTQVDPRIVRDIRNVRTVSCFPVGDPATPVRRAGAKGPGIELTGDSVPTSVDIVRADPANLMPDVPTTVIGYFAIVTAANGANFIVNVDDDDFEDLTVQSNPLTTPVPLTIAHQLRDGIPERGLLAEIDSKLICDTTGPDPDSSAGNVGGPRTVSNPSRGVPSGTFAAEKVSSLPNIRHVTCTDGATMAQSPVSELGFAASIEQREIAYPDLRALRADETWTLTWEGSLSNDRPETAIDGPGVREGLIAVDGGGMRLADPTRPFCDAGVERHDLVQLRGCDPALGNGDCPIGYECYVHPNSQVSGLGACLLVEEADRLANACEQFLTSLRRYTVSKSASGSLTLVPRKRVLRTTPITGCIDTAQCTALADYAATNFSSEHPAADETEPAGETYTCAPDADRPGGLNRCIMTCATTADCSIGTVCDAAADGDNNPATGYCMEGVVPPQACVNAPQRFELRSHDAFTVVGTRSGYVHPIIADAGGNCVSDPAANPLQIGRIPLDAPLCDPATNPLTGRKPDGTFDANPCKLTVTETEYQPRYADTNCALANPASELVERPATAIRFRNPGMTYTLIDPTYPGDLTCNGDRKGTLSNVPTVFNGYQLSFRQTGGFSPLTLPISPAYPVKVVRGPGQSIWVIDQGDFLSTSATQASTRGRVFRIEAAILTAISRLE